MLLPGIIENRLEMVCVSENPEAGFKIRTVKVMGLAMW